MCRASSPRAELEASDPSRRRGPPGRQPVGVRHGEQEAVRRQTAAQAAPKHGSPSCRTASTRAFATGRCRRRGCERHGGGRGLGPWPTKSAVPHASWWSWPERPPSFDAWYGIGEGWDVHAHPPSVGRSLRSSNPVREGHRSPGTGASRTWRLGLWPKPSGATPDLLVDARTPEPAAGKRGDPPPRSGAQTAFPLGTFGRERPLEGGGQRVKTHLAPRPYQALGLGGRSPPRPCCPVRHRRPGGDERNSKRPHGIGESGVCAPSGVHCVHRPPTSHARSSTAQVVGLSSESRPHEPNRPPCVGALHQPPTRLPARTLRQRDAALHGGLQAAVFHEDPDITLDDGPVDPVDLAADFVVEFGGVGISRPVGEHRLRPAPLVRCPDDVTP